jgi:hypothetical protein
MLDRRLFLGGLCASLPVIALPGALRAQARRPRLHAMVVGINKYVGAGPSGKVLDLEGCINDANDIARQVARLDPDVRVLGARDEPVTRASFFSAWRSMLAAARKDDTLFLTYAGHGGQIAEACAGNEDDGLDETLILTDFDVRHTADRVEHIIDDELATLWAAAAEKDLRVVFIADSCFSGTAYRRIELADRKRYRTIRSYQLAPGGAPPVSCRQQAVPEIPPNLLFIAGSQENEPVPEMELNGVRRGALSVAVARALEGGADTNRDGIITGDELTDYVLSYVEALADSSQHPTASFQGANRSTPNEVVGASVRGALVVLRDGGTTAPVVQGPAPPPPLAPVRLQIRGLTAAERARIASSLTNATVVRQGEPSALIWDPAQRLVFNDQGMRIAEEIGPGELQRVVDRRRLMDRIVQMSAGRGLSVTIHLFGQESSPASIADATHREGRTLQIRIGGITEGHYFTVVNFTGSGKVELAEPSEKIVRARPHVQFNSRHLEPIGVEVRSPFGADHVVAVAGQRRLTQLMPAIAKAHGQYAVAAVLEALDREAAGQALQVGFKGIYTTRA